MGLNRNGRQQQMTMNDKEGQQQWTTGTLPKDWGWEQTMGWGRNGRWPHRSSNILSSQWNQCTWEWLSEQCLDHFVKLLPRLYGQCYRHTFNWSTLRVSLCEWGDSHRYRPTDLRDKSQDIPITCTTVPVTGWANCGVPWQASTQWHLLVSFSPWSKKKFQPLAGPPLHLVQDSHPDTPLDPDLSRPWNHINHASQNWWDFYGRDDANCQVFQNLCGECVP